MVILGGVTLRKKVHYLTCNSDYGSYQIRTIGGLVPVQFRGVEVRALHRSISFFHTRLEPTVSLRNCHVETGLLGAKLEAHYYLKYNLML